MQSDTKVEWGRAAFVACWSWPQTSIPVAWPSQRLRGTGKSGFVILLASGSDCRIVPNS